MKEIVPLMSLLHFLPTTNGLSIPISESMSGDKDDSRSILSNFILLINLVTSGYCDTSPTSNNFAIKAFLSEVPAGSNLSSTPTFEAKSKIWFPSNKENITSHTHLRAGDDVGIWEIAFMMILA